MRGSLGSWRAASDGKRSRSQGQTKVVRVLGESQSECQGFQGQRISRGRLVLSAPSMPPTQPMGVLPIAGTTTYHSTTTATTISAKSRVYYTTTTTQPAHFLQLGRESEHVRGLFFLQHFSGDGLVGKKYRILSQTRKVNSTDQGRSRCTSSSHNY